MEISIFYEGTPVSENSKKIQKIFDKYKGEFQGGGTMFENDVPGPDVQYKIAKKFADAAINDLKEAGFEHIRSYK